MHGAGSPRLMRPGDERVDLFRLIFVLIGLDNAFSAIRAMDATLA